MHLQTTVPDWPKAWVKMPYWSLLKAVNDPAILVDGYGKMAAAGRNPDKFYYDYRHMDFDYTLSTDYEVMKEKWRTNFSRFVDGTYLDKYAPFVNLVEELNEYTDTRHVTDNALLMPALTNARAAVAIWNGEFRGKGPIRSDCRLVICNSPVGNDIPKEFFQLAYAEDAVLGVHLYTHWINKQRDPQDFRYHSGRCFYNEQAYGIKPLYAITESGPYNGVLEGWLHNSVMGGDRLLLYQGMELWWQDLATTAAYREGRILGPGAWFTSSTLNDQWKYYRLFNSELEPLAERAALIWKPGTSPPPPPPPEPEPECRGKPRVQYKRIYWVLSDGMDTEQENEVWRLAKTNKRTLGWSNDDAGIGDLDNRVAVLWNIPQAERQTYIDWYAKYYPGVTVVFRRTTS